MVKAYYFLGSGVLVFLLFSFLSPRNTDARRPLKNIETPKEIAALGQQLGFISNFSLLALQKIDNPGVFSFAEELNTQYFDLSNSFRMMAAEKQFQAAYQPGAPEKKKLHELKYTNLEHFEVSFLRLLIPELEKTREMITAAHAVDGPAEMKDLIVDIDHRTRKYLKIAEELMAYREHL